MIQKTVEWAASALESPYSGNRETTFHGVSTDSRQINPGMLYVPLAGARVDGHSFIEQVKEKGAAAALWQKDHLPYPEGISLILVDDTQKALQNLAKKYLQTLSCKRIGITGSNGKTSTKDMTASILSQSRKTQKTQGNHNNEIGLPLTILDLDEDTEAAILEMGMENFKEISFLCSLAPLDTAVICSIGSAHKENLGSRENIARAKLEILEGLKKGGTFIYNADSPEIEKVLPEFELDPSWTVIPYGKEQACTISSAPVLTKDGIEFEADCLGQGKLNVHAAGFFQADNALAASLAAGSLGASFDDMQQGLQQAELSAMRGQILKAGSASLIDDTYKSNPESAAQGLRTLASMPAAVHIAALSDMLDLGEDEIALHAGIGELAKELGIDYVFTTGERSKATSEAFGAKGQHFETKEALTLALEPFLEQDAVVLIKGSRAMKMEEVTKGLLEKK